MLPGSIILLVILCLGLVTIAGAQVTETFPDEDWTVPRLQPEAVEKAADILTAIYQTELPVRSEQDRAARKPATVTGPRAILPNILHMIGMILGAILVVVVLVNLLFSADRWAQNESPEAADGTAIGFGRLNLEDPDRLAASGRYAEAIHVMLLRALALASGRLSLTWPHSLTSREIMDSADLTDQARESLDDLIARVEIHHFGGRTPREDDFRHCRLVFERLAADPIRVRT